MTPTFLGIGVPRGGTTWLHELLSVHPDVAMPTRRKEVHYFDRDYDRGLAWYESFFPPDEGSWKTVGEITPHYLYGEACPERIAQMASVRKLILILRLPIERAFSHYVYRMRQDNFQGDFEAFLDARPEALAWGRYVQPIRRYFNHFDRDRFLILIHEQVFKDIDTARKRVTDAIGIDEPRFPEQAGQGRVNAVVLPRHRRLAHWSSNTGAFLRRRNLDWVPNLIGRRLGVKRLFGKSSAPKPKLDPELRDRLTAPFLDEISTLEELIGVNLDIWRPNTVAAREGET